VEPAPERVRVLFVDDDPSILGALRRLFHRERPTWDMTFVEGGPAALAELRRSSYDVVVTDLRMPDLDGGTLLAVVAAERPATVRIIVSGYADPNLSERARQSAHLVLTKPCDRNELREAIVRLVATGTGP
jgi:CheY-like chemotaxis protein